MFEWFVKKLCKDNRGFTLIELVVVIAILGILAFIAVPKLSGTTQKAAISAHNANVRTLESAANMYIADNPGVNITSSNEDQKKLEPFVQEWPTVPKGIKKTDGTPIEKDTKYVVTITDGEIKVLPGKVNDEKTGKVSEDLPSN